MKKLLELIKKLFGSSGSDSSSSSEKGFTLIELLIVMAVLGVLAAAVLIAIDPIEQFARGRDSGIKQSVTTLGRGVQNYYTAQLTWPTADNTWITTLVNSGEVKTAPSGYNISALVCNGGGLQNSICYKQSLNDFVVYTRLESKIERNKGSGGNLCGNQANNTWYVYSSQQGRAGTVCQSGEPGIGTFTFF